MCPSGRWTTPAKSWPLSSTCTWSPIALEIPDTLLPNLIQGARETHPSGKTAQEGGRLAWLGGAALRDSEGGAADGGDGQLFVLAQSRVASAGQADRVLSVQRHLGLLPISVRQRGGAERSEGIRAGAYG